MKSTSFPLPYGQAQQNMANFESCGHFPRFSGSRLPASAAPLLTAQAVGLANAGPDIAPWFTACNYSPAGNSQGEFGENIAKPRGDLAVLVALVAKVARETTPGKKGNFGTSGVILGPMMTDSAAKACRSNGRPSVNSGFNEARYCFNTSSIIRTITDWICKPVHTGRQPGPGQRGLELEKAWTPFRLLRISQEILWAWEH